MSFNDLEQKLKQFYQRVENPRLSPQSKRRIQYEALEALRNKKAHHHISVMGFLGTWLRSFKWKPTVAFAALVLVAGNLLGQKPTTTLMSVEGLVTVYREGTSHLVTDSFVLEPGDLIETASSAKGQILSDGHFLASLGSNAEVRYTLKHDLFVTQGDVLADLWKSGKILTDRGVIQTENIGQVRVRVSPTGETKVVLQKDNAYVQDWQKSKQVLAVGDEIRFRTDTVLANVEIPEGLSLSLDQILALRSQLAISRTKAVNALEQLALRNPEQAAKQLASAEKSFRGSIQVLHSDRSLSVGSHKDVSVFSNSDVLVMMKERKADDNLVQEAQALSQLFALMENESPLFTEDFTGLNTFDRYRMLDNAFALGGDESGELGEILKQKYAVAFLQDIQNQELSVTQQKVLDQHLALLPQTATASEFLDRVAAMSDPNLAKLLQQKRKARFS